MIRPVRIISFTLMTAFDSRGASAATLAVKPPAPVVRRTLAVGDDPPAPGTSGIPEL